MKRIDISNQKFGRLLVKEYDSQKQKWRCICSCGRECFVTGSNLRGGQQSCGCLNRELLLKRNSIKKLNSYTIYDNYYVGYDSNDNEFYFDLEDYDKIKNYTWLVRQNGYVETTINNKSIKQHRMIMNSPDDLDIDHINGIRNDNRRRNLRMATKSNNNKNRKININNTTGAKGVRKLPSNNYCSTIQCNGHRITIGTFKTIKEAADAYDKKAVELFGEFARLNNYKED